MKVFLQKELGLETDEITIEKKTEEGKKKDHHSKIFKLPAALRSVKQKQEAEIMGGSNVYKQILQ